MRRALEPVPVGSLTRCRGDRPPLDADVAPDPHRPLRGPELRRSTKAAAFACTGGSVARLPERPVGDVIRPSA